MKMAETKCSDGELLLRLSVSLSQSVSLIVVYPCECDELSHLDLVIVIEQQKQCISLLLWTHAGL